MLHRAFLVRCPMQPPLVRSLTTRKKAHLQRVQVAIIGSGPSGCYLADCLVKKHPNIHVDIYERLPVPFGLVRYGVAPDHPEVKNVEKRFIEIFKSDNVSWIGNVNIGEEITVAQLREAYSAVVVATGADRDRKLDNIPGHDLVNVFSAREFVNYYNTLPFPYATPLTPPFDIRNVRSAMLIGNGNVALDIARILGTNSRHWCQTDINCCAARELIENRIRRVSIIGRRGPEHAAFTTAEFRELCNLNATSRNEMPSAKKGGKNITNGSGVVNRALPESTTDVIQGSVNSPVLDKNQSVRIPYEEHVDVLVDPFDLDSTLAKTDGSRARKRLLELMSKHTVRNRNEMSTTSTSGINETATLSHHDISDTKERGPCTIDFKFHLRPIQFIPRPDRNDHIGGVIFERTHISEGVKEQVTIPTDVVFTSIGYKATAIPGIPFDEALGIIPNIRGRVLPLEMTSSTKYNSTSIISEVRSEDHVIPGLYCCGWVKRGPKGVILSAMMDAQDTAAVIVEDLIKQGEGEGVCPANVDTKRGKFSLMDFITARKIMPMSINRFERILKFEKAQGEELGKRLEKIPDTNTMLDIAIRVKEGHNEEIKEPSIELMRELLDSNISNISEVV
eukprot:Tbor_TRINITY_DN4836_c0_g1::TRINITY_DN4836_c0_g1_i1::g.1236::m.1236/K18914/FDXR; adrenodoxin-NADP+ reductase